MNKGLKRVYQVSILSDTGVLLYDLFFPTRKMCDNYCFRNGGEYNGYSYHDPLVARSVFEATHRLINYLKYQGV